MIKEARGYGNTIDEARENAVAMLNASENDDIQFEVIATPKKKTLRSLKMRKKPPLPQNPKSRKDPTRQRASAS